MDSVSINSSVSAATNKINEHVNVKIERIIVKTETVTMDEMIREKINKKENKNNGLYVKLIGFLDEIKTGKYTLDDYADAIADFVNNKQITEYECEHMSKIFELNGLYKRDFKPDDKNNSNESWADINENDPSFEEFFNKNLLKDNKNNKDNINTFKPSYAKVAAVVNTTMNNNVVITRKSVNNDKVNEKKNNNYDDLHEICSQFKLDYESVHNKIFINNNHSFKSIMCENYNNNCKYGNNCNFAHSEVQRDTFKNYLRKYSNFENDYTE